MWSNRSGTMSRPGAVAATVGERDPEVHRGGLVAQERSVLVPPAAQVDVHPPEVALRGGQRRWLTEVVGHEPTHAELVEQLGHLEEHPRAVGGPHAATTARPRARPVLDPLVGRHRLDRGEPGLGLLVALGARVGPPAIEVVERLVDAADQPVDHLGWKQAGDEEAAAVVEGGPEVGDVELTGRHERQPLRGVVERHRVGCGHAGRHDRRLVRRPGGRRGRVLEDVAGVAQLRERDLESRVGAPGGWPR